MNITLLISTFNRGALLARSLERLTELTIPEEVLIVDDGSDDFTAATCDRMSDHLPLTYIYSHNPYWSICSMARNIGVKHARHDWIATSEPELMFLTDVIKQYKELSPEHPREVISGGTVYFMEEGEAPPEPKALWPYTEGLEQAGDYTPPTATTPAIGWVAPFTALYNREWIMDVGGWDEHFPGPWGWDDIDLLTRLRIKGINQHIALPVAALHQWHGPKHRGDVDFQNEHYFRAKSFVAGGVESPDLPDIIANVGHEWGVIRPREV